jgi:hypothetical protein
MRKRLRDNGLSLTMFGLFLLFLLGHSLAGYYDYNADQHAHGQPAVRYGAYLTSGHFWATVFENWESEFLQMAAKEARQNNLSISLLNVLRSALCRTQQARPLQQSLSF